MTTRITFPRAACALTFAACLPALAWTQSTAPYAAVQLVQESAKEPSVNAPEESPLDSTEQGQTPMSESFQLDTRRWRLEQRRDAFKDAQFNVHLRTYYLNRGKYDGTKNEAWAGGGWVGLKTGYFLDRVAFGVTGYTSQHLAGDNDTDGTLLLKPGQEGYSVLGEIYADIRITDDIHLYIGRQEYDTPYINRNDSRMTPNTFEAITLSGKMEFEEGKGSLRYGGGYFNKIKERNDDTFVSMAKDAGADAERGVFTAGVIYQNGGFSLGAIDYFSPDNINIAHAEAKYEFEAGELKPRLALQFSDQRNTGDNLLQEEDFSAQLYGLKAELPVGDALLTAALTHTGSGDMQNPWSGYPGFTSVQVEDFNRKGETAFLLRAAYDIPVVDGLSAYALWVHGTDPDSADGFQRDEVDLNIQYAPANGPLEGMLLHLRYAIVNQDDAASDDLEDFRVIASYNIKW